MELFDDPQSPKVLFDELVFEDGLYEALLNPERSLEHDRTVDQVTNLSWVREIVMADEDLAESGLALAVAQAAADLGRWRWRIFRADDGELRCEGARPRFGGLIRP